MRPGVECSAAEQAAAKEYSGEFLEAARYGELEDLKTIFGHPRLRELIDFQNLVDEHSSSSALMFAAANDHIECIVFLVESVGIDINKVNASGNTALHWAALNGHTEAVTFLISKGGNVLLENKFQRTPFDEAIERDQKDCCEVLVKEEVRLHQLSEGMDVELAEQLDAIQE
jgi:ankyrin repeat protein